MVCREAPVTYRDDVALEDAWYKEVRTVGLNHTMVSRLAQWRIGVVGVVSRQLEELLVAGNIWVTNGEWPRGVVLPALFIMTRTNGVTQNIQLVSSLFQSYWLSTSEYSTF